jgi:hypothetical protein
VIARCRDLHGKGDRDGGLARCLGKSVGAIVSQCRRESTRVLKVLNVEPRSSRSHGADKCYWWWSMNVVRRGDGVVVLVCRWCRSSTDRKSDEVTTVSGSARRGCKETDNGWRLLVRGLESAGSEYECVSDCGGACAVQSGPMRQDARGMPLGNPYPCHLERVGC